MILGAQLSTSRTSKSNSQNSNYYDRAFKAHVETTPSVCFCINIKQCPSDYEWNPTWSAATMMALRPLRPTESGLGSAYNLPYSLMMKVAAIIPGGIAQRDCPNHRDITSQTPWWTIAPACSPCIHLMLLCIMLSSFFPQWWRWLVAQMIYLSHH